MLLLSAECTDLQGTVQASKAMHGKATGEGGLRWKAWRLARRAPCTLLQP